MGWAYRRDEGVEKYIYSTLVGKPEGKIIFERPRRKYESNIEVNLKETGFEDVG
jgi:hypothetical protein